MPNKHNETDPGNPNESREMWVSFLSTISFTKESNECDTPPYFLRTEFYRHTGDQERRNRGRKRLPIFVQLSCGEFINHTTRSLPHIHKFPCNSNVEGKNKPKDSYLRQSERCWKSLLLQNNGRMGDEWTVVMDHFTNYSRSKKVLNILQQ